MSDRELLELAAKVYGAVDTHAWSDKFAIMMPGNEDFNLWNPLYDDGDSFRLLFAIKADVYHGTNEQDERIITIQPECLPLIDAPSALEDSPANVRRAIVRAAAAMGEQL